MLTESSLPSSRQLSSALTSYVEKVVGRSDYVQKLYVTVDESWLTAENFSHIYFM